MCFGALGRTREGICAILFLLPAVYLSSCSLRRPPAIAESAAGGRRPDWLHNRLAYPDGIPPGAALRAWQQLEAMEAGLPLRHTAAAAGTAVNPLQWVPIGPAPIGAANYGNHGPNAGIVSSLAIDPRNPNVIYAGAGNAGVWKSTNGGGSWAPLTDTQPGIGTTTVALDPFQPDTVYASTGARTYETSAGCGSGVGLLKSADGGATWTIVGGTATTAPGGKPAAIGNINALAVNPAKRGVMLAVLNDCVTQGLYRSADSGATWSLVQAGNIISAVFGSDGQYAYAGADYGVVYGSADGGQTWSKINGSGANSIPTTVGNEVARAAFVAVAPWNSAVVMASLDRDSDSQLFGLYLSQDYGKTWKTLVNAPDYCGTQCWYNPALAFHPKDPSILYAGGLNFYRSTDGGLSWTDIGGPQDGVRMHVDHHGIAFSPDASALYVTNDGGIWKTAAPTAASPAWTALNSTLAITEFYALATSPSDLSFSIGGTQDNGTIQVSAGDWESSQQCGDGGQVAIDPSNPNNVYVACAATEWIVKSTAGGAFGTWQRSDTGVASADHAAWVPPLLIDPAQPSHLFYGTYRAYQTTNGGARWIPISGDLTGGGTEALTTLAVAADSTTVYSGSSDGKLYVTTNAGAGATWVSRAAGLPNRYVNGITTDPTDPQTAYVVYSGYGTGHIYKTANQGKTWTDISGNLPDTSVDDLTIDPDLPGVLYAGTDIGVFRTTDQKLWAPLGAGLPHAIVNSVKLHRATRTLRAATYGRSVWDLGVPLNGPRLTSANPATLKTNTAATLSLSGANLGSGCTGQVNGAAFPTSTAADGTLSLRLNPSDVASPGTLTVTVLCAAGLSNPLLVTVDGPQISSGGVLSGASFQAGVVSGGWTTIRGTKLSATTRSWGAADFNGNNLPTALDGVSVTIGGKPAYVYYISPTQLNVLAPDDAATGSVPVVVTNSLGISNTATATKVALAPELFTTSLANVAYAAATDGAEYIGPVGLYGSGVAVRPARPGESVTLYGTGMGPTAPAYPAGSLLAGALPAAGTVRVLINGAAAPVQFAGLIGPGLYQINVQVPDTTPLANVPVVLEVNGVQSAAKVSLAVGLPDLTITRFVVPTTGTVGVAVSPMSVSIVNNGTAPAGPFRVGFYLSTTWDVTAADLAGQRYTGWSCTESNTLAPKAAYVCNGSVGIPSDLAPGTWFFIAYADDLQQVTESNEANNVRPSDNGATVISK
jgi:uncharacterized protein (TIGR03437 family)